MNTFKTEYQIRAEATRSTRQAKGFYASAAHLAAGRKLINQGVTALTVEELETMSTHPFFRSQSEYFAALAAALA
jgi:hypothetical protein